MNPIHRTFKLSDIKIYQDTEKTNLVASAPSGTLTISNGLPPRQTITLDADNIHPQSGLRESAPYTVDYMIKPTPDNEVFPQTVYQFTGYDVFNGQVDAHFKRAVLVEEQN